MENKRTPSKDTSGMQTSFFGPAPVFSLMAGATPKPMEPAMEQPVEYEEVIDYGEDLEFSAEETVTMSVPPPLPLDPADPLARFKVMSRLDRH